MNGRMSFAGVAVGVVVLGCAAAPSVTKSAESSGAPRQRHAAQPASRASAVVKLAPDAGPPMECEVHGESYQAHDDAKYSPHVVDEDVRTASAASCQRLRSQYGKRTGIEITCFETNSKEQGVWALVVSSPASVGDYFKPHLAYIDDKGQVSRSGLPAASPGGDPAIAGNDASTVPEVVAIVDYDADGHSELITRVTAASDAAGNMFNRFAIWTVRAVSVVPFGNTNQHHFIDMLDQDDDGRPELLEDPYGVMVGSPLGWLRAKRPWSQLVQIDTSGTLVINGEVSRAFALNLCPRGDTLLDWLPKVEPDCVAGYVHCATLWNLPIDAIDAALDRQCERDETSISWCEASRPGWEQIARTKPPFALHKPKKAP